MDVPKLLWNYVNNQNFKGFERFLKLELKKLAVIFEEKNYQLLRI